jgi:uncharacterized protein (DUF736 family)
MRSTIAPNAVEILGLSKETPHNAAVRIGVLQCYVPPRWRRSEEGRDNLSVKRDDPSFNAAIGDLR